MVNIDGLRLDPDASSTDQRRNTGLSEPAYRDVLRAETLAIGERQVAEEGLDGLQARRIAREAGCSVGSLYNVFGDLDRFIVEVNTLTLEKLRLRLEAALNESGARDMRSGFLVLALAYARFALEHSRAWEAVFKHRRPKNAVAMPRHQQEQQRLLGLIDGILEAIEPNAERRAGMARALFGAVHGIVTLAVDDRLEGVVRSELESQITFLVDTLVRGLGIR